MTPGASYSRQLYCTPVVISGKEHPPCRRQSYIRPGIRLWLMPWPSTGWSRSGTALASEKGKRKKEKEKGGGRGGGNFFHVTDLWSPQAQKNGLVLQRSCTFLGSMPSTLSCENAKSCKDGGRGRLGARNMCVMLPLSFGALPSLAAPAEDSTDAVKTATKCA